MPGGVIPNVFTEDTGGGVASGTAGDSAGVAAAGGVVPDVFGGGGVAAGRVGEGAGVAGAGGSLASVPAGSTRRTGLSRE